MPRRSCRGSARSFAMVRRWWWRRRERVSGKIFRPEGPTACSLGRQPQVGGRKDILSPERAAADGFGERCRRPSGPFSDRNPGIDFNFRIASEMIEREKPREREQELLQMFNEAAAEITEEDLEERESLLGGFAGANQETMTCSR